jgi:DNA-binding response OmpR family regulator
MSQKKVLIVDDEPAILMSLEFLLRKNNYKVFVARNGTEAQEVAHAELPDVVVLDIMMPDVDGYQVCTFIKTHPQLADTKVIFLSAKGKDSDIEKGMALGADAYLTKPFGTKHLLEQIKSLS